MRQEGDSRPGARWFGARRAWPARGMLEKISPLATWKAFHDNRSFVTDLGLVARNREEVRRGVAEIPAGHGRGRVARRLVGARATGRHGSGTNLVTSDSTAGEPRERADPMFPYRRGSKKRGKGGGAGGGRRFDGGRRGPGGVHEILSQLQPATKALAQVLAGNARISGQLAHAKNLLAQAERAVEEKAIDRLAPAQREEFLEQLARLKLTVADADAAIGEPAEPRPAPVDRPAAVVDPERLRALALSLAASTAREPPRPPAAPVALEEEIEAPPPAASAPAPTPTPVVEPGSPRASRLRLKTTVLPRER